MGVAIKAIQLIALLARKGFMVIRQTSSHAILKHPLFPTRNPTVPLHNKDLKIGTLKSILKQSGISWKEFLKMLGR